MCLALDQLRRFIEISGLKSFFALRPWGKAQCLGEPKVPPKFSGGGGGAPNRGGTPGGGGGGGHPGKGGGGGGGGGADMLVEEDGGGGGPTCEACPTWGVGRLTGTAPIWKEKRAALKRYSHCNIIECLQINIVKWIFASQIWYNFRVNCRFTG